jgi:hypothetical protein
MTALLLGLAAGVGTAQAHRLESEYRPLVFSVVPTVDIPLPPDHRLFQVGGGVAARIGTVFPFFPRLSAGAEVVYRLAPMEHPDLGDLGSLSLISGEASVELRYTFAGRIDIHLAGGVGWFYALLNEDPSQWVGNVALSGRLGAGLRASPCLSVSVQGEYRRYQSLYHLIGIGVALDLRLGGLP